KRDRGEAPPIGVERQPGGHFETPVQADELLARVRTPERGPAVPSDRGEHPAVGPKGHVMDRPTALDGPPILAGIRPPQAHRPGWPLRGGGRPGRTPRPSPSSRAP